MIGTAYESYRTRISQLFPVQVYYYLPGFGGQVSVASNNSGLQGHTDSERVQQANLHNSANSGNHFEIKVPVTLEKDTRHKLAYCSHIV